MFFFVLCYQLKTAALCREYRLFEEPPIENPTPAPTTTPPTSHPTPNPFIAVLLRRRVSDSGRRRVGGGGGGRFSDDERRGGEGRKGKFDVGSFLRSVPESFMKPAAGMEEAAARWVVCCASIYFSRFCRRVSCVSVQCFFFSLFGCFAFFCFCRPLRWKRNVRYVVVRLRFFNAFSHVSSFFWCGVVEVVVLCALRVAFHVLCRDFLCCSFVAFVCLVFCFVFFVLSGRRVWNFNCCVFFL